MRREHVEPPTELKPNQSTVASYNEHGIPVIDVLAHLPGEPEAFFSNNSYPVSHEVVDNRIAIINANFHMNRLVEVKAVPTLIFH
jgi:hypothetical protein